jgi:hypothetical protein
MIDPYVEEIRKIREEMAAEYGYDLKRFMAAAREWDAESKGTFVDWPVHKPTPVSYPQALQELQDAPPMVVAEEAVGYGSKQEPDEGR